MVIDGDFSDVDKFFEGGELDVESAMAKVGEEAVEDAKANHTYKNRTRNLESSNKYETDKDGLTLSNTADYASYVEAKGFDVLSGSALRAEKKLKEIFE
ncbi:hypothetical protein HMPREF0650_0382 [Hoylesella buccalis ATCC 35310]|uniref:Uncharacterized protein n=1 Tax=Hoylesella buccalis ATCC 35310 TaxID=679190 RepID=D1W5P7_9BACT|nr:HK97 gp10 family phage protein [Hoylesella buccalis]EFA92144.1 hypothetical protein HMPREF0650_0382 [Hoylesella buccalis ATCC 35310]